MSAVFNAFPSVDTFFLIGATLLSYITLKELDKSKGSGVVFWIKFYVHRYIRQIQGRIMDVMKMVQEFDDLYVCSYVKHTKVQMNLYVVHQKNYFIP